MKVALIQMNSGSDKAANIAAAKALMEQAIAEERPDWICLPEVWDCMGGSLEEKRAIAETLPGGPAYEMMEGLARRHGVVIHGGSIL
jgi:predicted amidohydrolase